MERHNYSSASAWEEMVGYSRAVKAGNLIFISGTTATDDRGNIIGEHNVYKQAQYIFKRIEKVLNEAGAGLKDVVRTRMFITDISKWEEAGKAHAEFFKDIRPAATMVEVKSLISPELLIEIEVDAVIAE